MGGVYFEELVSSDRHLTELGKCFSRPGLPEKCPERNPEEIRQELFRLRGRWDRIVELKHMGARIAGRSAPLVDYPRINFPQKQYEDHVKRYPENAELLNKDILNFGWMKSIWGPIPEVIVPRQRAASVGGGASSKKVIEDDDDDFMPSKRAQNRGKAPVASERGGSSCKNRSKGSASSKRSKVGKSVAPTKGVEADYDSADEFMTGKLVQVTFGRNREDLWKPHVSENSDDDFM